MLFKFVLNYQPMLGDWNSTNCREFKHIKAGIRMEVMETWYFQIWVNYGGMAEYSISLRLVLALSFIYIFNTCITFNKMTKNNPMPSTCSFISGLIKQMLFSIHLRSKDKKNDNKTTTLYIIRAVTWDFQQCGMCDQQRLRPACAYAQSDQSLC